MNIYIGTFNKEINSLKTPDFDRDLTVEYHIQLKESCSILEPKILLAVNNFSTTWNYCYIPQWDRYYYIHDATIAPGGVWELTLSCDVLATWHDYIINSTAYVSRSESHFDKWLEDPVISHSLEATTFSKTIRYADRGSDNLVAGSFVMGVMSNDTTTASPTVSHYAMDANTLADLTQYVFSNEFFDLVSQGIDSAGSNFTKAFFNPFQFVVSCMWFPFNLAKGNKANIKFGWWDSGVKATKLIDETTKLNYKSAFTLKASNWTDLSESWAHYTIYVPGIGQLPIPAQYANYSIIIDITTDVLTGESMLLLIADHSIIGSASGKLGCSVQLSSTHTDYLGAMTSKATLFAPAIGGAIGGLSGAFTGGDSIAEKLASAGGGIAEGVEKGLQASLQPIGSTTGSNGSRQIILNHPDIVISTTKYLPYTSDTVQAFGGKCNRVLPLYKLHGYTEIKNPKIKIPTQTHEVQAVYAYLQGGFIIE